MSTIKVSELFKRQYFFTPRTTNILISELPSVCLILYLEGACSNSGKKPQAEVKGGVLLTSPKVYNKNVYNL